ncbi:MAG: serine hydrolase domain-containing protein [Planctomycetota bacterium]
MTSLRCASRCTLAGLAALCAAPAARGQACDYAATDAAARAIVDARPLIAGGGLRLEDPLLPGPSLESFYGGYDASTAIPIASATKLLSAIVVMTCVERDGLDLDEPVATYLPEFVGLKGTMTVRQMFSHTSGLPGQSPFVGATDITLAEAVRRIAAETPLEAMPGTRFCYGGVSMHVAGRVCEVVSGTDWDTLFAERVAIPLGMTATDYDGLAVTTNPRIAGGAQSSLRDYARVIRMLVDGGVYRGTRILERASIDAMFADQTADFPFACTPPSVGDRRYGLGVWVLDRADGTAIVESPGAFGWTPWVELDTNGAPILGGVFMVQDSFARLAADIEGVQARALADRSACTPCAADLDADGRLTLFDFLAFQVAFAVGAQAGDYDRSGALDLFDFLAFSNDFALGCP